MSNMKRVRTKSSDVATNREKQPSPRRRTKSSDVNGKIQEPSPPRSKVKNQGLRLEINGIDEKPENRQYQYGPSKFNLRIISYGRVGGPIPEPEDGEEMLKFSVRDVASPPAKLRRNFTGLSPRLRKEVFSDKQARAKYDLMVIEIEKMMTQMETGVSFDAENKNEIDDEVASKLIVGIQCDEGRHRSVSYAEELSQSIKRKDWDVQVEHRDLGITESPGEDDEEDENEEPPTPLSANPLERIKTKKRRDKDLKKARDRRMQVEATGLAEADGLL